MAGVSKIHLTETDIITKFILPAIKEAGWDVMTQIRQEVKLRDGKVVVRGKLAARLTVKSTSRTKSSLWRRSWIPRPSASSTT